MIELVRISVICLKIWCTRISAFCNCNYQKDSANKDGNVNEEKAIQVNSGNDIVPAKKFSKKVISKNEIDIDDRNERIKCRFQGISWVNEISAIIWLADN